MLSLRRHFGTAGLLVAVAALIAALGGSAVAANGGGSGDATASAKKGGGNVNKLIKRESRKFSKRFSLAFSKRFPGPIGPQGFPGLPGAPGSDGEDGSDGSNGSDGSDGSDGTNGTDGKSVEVTPLAAGECANEEGGAEVKQEGAAEGVEVCNGEPGEDATFDGGPLPSGVTIKGSWHVGQVNATAAGDPLYLSLSFPLPLESAPNGVVYSAPSNPSPACPGSAAEPTVGGPGFLCIYPAATENWKVPISGLLKAVSAENIKSPNNKIGAVLEGEAEAAGLAGGYGSWAIEAP